MSRVCLWHFHIGIKRAACVLRDNTVGDDKLYARCIFTAPAIKLVSDNAGVAAVSRISRVCLGQSK